MQGEGMNRETGRGDVELARVYGRIGRERIIKLIHLHGIFIILLVDNLNEFF